MNKSIIIAILCLILLGCIRIAATYPHLSQTYDEPAHIACGMEWLDKGTFNYEPQHPPLTRIAVALGPYLTGSTSQGRGSIWTEGNAILYSADHERILTLARIGNLFFFILASIGVFVVAWKLYSPLTAITALFVFTMMPAVLGNAGIATTDIGAAAFFFPAIIAFAYWFKKPTLNKSLLMGLLMALSVFSKFSSILFLGVSGLVVMLTIRFFRTGERDGKINFRMIGMAFAALTIFLLTGWACYRFSVQPLFVFPRDLPWVDLFSAKLHIPRDILMKLGEVGFPLSEFVRGIGAVAKHNVEGHGAYLLGQTSLHGWWYYYPVVLSIKIPLVILGTILTGVFFLFKDLRASNRQFSLLPLIISLTVLLSCMFISNINIGIRHLLPIFPLLAIIAGYGLARLFSLPLAGKLAGAALVAGIAVTSITAHPDYLSFFNLIAKDKPYEYDIKCDLDWGQHLDTMIDRLHELGVEKVAIAYVGTADLSKHGLPEYTDISEDLPDEIIGWVAINAHPLFINPKFAWLHKYEPLKIIKKTFFLFHFETPVPTHD